MMKFQPPKSTEEQIQENLSKAKQELTRKQFPTKYAPTLDASEVIVLSGCAFTVHKQDKNKLILKADEKLNFENGVNVLRSLSYLVGAYDFVSIQGWDWRTIKFKGDKLTLKPHSPTLLNMLG